MNRMKQPALAVWMPLLLVAAIGLTFGCSDTKFSDAATDAERRLRSAADRGDLDAMHSLGWAHLYKSISGTRRRLEPRSDLDTRAVEWLDLAMCLRNDPGFAGDRAVGEQLLRRAAAAGYARSMTALGYMYRKGRGVRRDHAAALDWFKQAHEGGDPAATYALAYQYKKGVAVELNAGLAVGLYRDAIDRGYHLALCGLATMYRDGVGVEQDGFEAQRLYEQAISLGLGSGYNDLGYLIQEGLVHGEGHPSYVELYQRAHELGLTRGTYNLGVVYRDGLGCEADAQRAIDLFYLAGSEGYAGAFWNLAWIYYADRDLPNGPGLCVKMMGRAAELNHVKAMRELALIRSGQQSDFGEQHVDYHAAVGWFTRAQELEADPSLWRNFAIAILKSELERCAYRESIREGMTRFEELVAAEYVLTESVQVPFMQMQHRGNYNEETGAPAYTYQTAYRTEYQTHVVNRAPDWVSYHARLLKDDLSQESQDLLKRCGVAID